MHIRPAYLCANIPPLLISHYLFIYLSLTSCPLLYCPAASEITPSRSYLPFAPAHTHILTHSHLSCLLIFPHTCSSISFPKFMSTYIITNHHPFAVRPSTHYINFPPTCPFISSRKFVSTYYNQLDSFNQHTHLFFFLTRPPSTPYTHTHTWPLD